MKRIPLIASALFLLGVGTARAQISNLYSWTGSNTAGPCGTLTISGNVMYGMTSGGGTHNDGNIFSINKDGSNYKDLYDFADTGSHPFNASGYEPYGNLTIVGNRFYGLTYAGGSNGYGQIFSVNMDGTGFKDLWDFADTGTTPHNSNGETPYGSFTLVGSKLYAYTYGGGAYGYGQIFSIDTLTKKFTDVYDYGTATNDPEEPYLGAFAVSASGTTLYGASYVGGLYGRGEVYSIHVDGTHLKDLHDFNTSDGEYPYSSVVLSGSKLFGMCYEGTGWGYGNIFTVDTTGNNFKSLLNFTYANGEYPQGDITVFGTKLYGMVYEGGIFNNGGVFSIDSNGNNYSDLADFNGITGANPLGSLSLVGGDTLYGMTEYGGNQNDGNIFRLVDSNINLGVNAVTMAGGTINVYPNPSNGQFTLRSSVGSGQCSVEVYNMLGEKVYSNYQITKLSNYQIDLSSQPNGVYLYKVISDSGNLAGQGKLVIQK